MPGNGYLARYLRYLVLQERASKIVKNTPIGLKFFVVGQNKNLQERNRAEQHLNEWNR